MSMGVGRSYERDTSLSETTWPTRIFGLSFLVGILATITGVVLLMLMGGPPAVITLVVGLVLTLAGAVWMVWFLIAGTSENAPTATTVTDNHGAVPQNTFLSDRDSHRH